MKQNKKIFIITSITILLLVIIPAGVTLGMHHYFFGDRVEHSNNYFEYLNSLNDEFVREEVTFESTAGQKLAGAFYTQSSTEDPKGLIIWVHGMSVSHENYLSEIEYMTREGYTVFSYDNTGVNKSEGDSLIGLTQAPLDLKMALEYIYSLGIYNDIPNILIGHSWGGFAVATVSQLDIPRPLDGIVSLAGFWKNTNVIKDIGRGYIGDAVKLMSPYLNMYENYIFKDDVTINGIDGLKAATGDVLFIHSENDSIVLYENNYEIYREIFEGNERFSFISYKKSGHQLTIEHDSYLRIHDIMHHQAHYEEGSEEYQKLNDERLSLITDYNQDVMGNISEFCERVTSKYVLEN